MEKRIGKNEKEILEKNTYRRILRIILNSKITISVIIFFFFIIIIEKK